MDVAGMLIHWSNCNIFISTGQPYPTTGICFYLIYVRFTYITLIYLRFICLSVINIGIGGDMMMKKKKVKREEIEMLDNVVKKREGEIKYLPKIRDKVQIIEACKGKLGLHANYVSKPKLSIIQHTCMDFSIRFFLSNTSIYITIKY